MSTLPCCATLESHLPTVHFWALGLTPNLGCCSAGTTVHFWALGVTPNLGCCSAGTTGHFWALGVTPNLGYRLLHDSPFLGAWGDAKFGLSLCCAARHVAVARRSSSCSTTVQFSGAWSDADMRWVSHCLDSNPRLESLESEKKPTELTVLLSF